MLLSPHKMTTTNSCLSDTTMFTSPTSSWLTSSSDEESSYLMNHRSYSLTSTMNKPPQHPFRRRNISNLPLSNSTDQPLTLDVIVDKSSFDDESHQKKKKRHPNVTTPSRDEDSPGRPVCRTSPNRRPPRTEKVRRKLRWRVCRSLGSPPKPPKAISSRHHQRSLLDTISSGSWMSNEAVSSTRSLHTFHSTETPKLSNVSNGPVCRNDGCRDDGCRDDVPVCQISNGMEGDEVSKHEDMLITDQQTDLHRYDDLLCDQGDVCSEHMLIMNEILLMGGKAAVPMTRTASEMSVEVTYKQEQKALSPTNANESGDVFHEEIKQPSHQSDEQSVSSLNRPQSLSSFPHTHTSMGPLSPPQEKPATEFNFNPSFDSTNHWMKHHQRTNSNEPIIPPIPSPEDTMQDRGVGLFFQKEPPEASIEHFAKSSNLCFEEDYNRNTMNERDAKLVSEQPSSPSPAPQIVNHGVKISTPPPIVQLLQKKKSDSSLPPIQRIRKAAGRSRKSTPVDVDEGTFLDAERNLRAIHEMATEHLEHGEYDEALDVFEEILRGQRERYGMEHARVGTALQNLGIVYLRKGEYEEAIQVCMEAVGVRRRSLGDDHPDVAHSLAQLGIAHLECDQHESALTAFLEALQIRRKFFGDKHPKVAKVLNNIGCTLFEIKDLYGAKMAFEETLEIQRSMLRSNKTNDSNTNQILLSIASTLCNIGSIQLRKGLFEEAIVALEEALLIQQSVLGDEHETVLNTIDSIEFVDQTRIKREEKLKVKMSLSTTQPPKKETKLFSIPNCFTPGSNLTKQQKRWYEAAMKKVQGVMMSSTAMNEEKEPQTETMESPNENDGVDFKSSMEEKKDEDPSQGAGDLYWI